MSKAFNELILVITAMKPIFQIFLFFYVQNFYKSQVLPLEK